MQFRHTEFDDTVNITQEHPLRVFTKYATALLVLVGGIYGGSTLLVDSIVERLDINTEIWIGESIASKLPAPAGESHIAEQQRYAESLFASIPKDDLPPLPYRIVVIEDEQPNAGALPGGLIMVHSGLFEHVSSENGLVFIFGHELGHYANRDHLKGLGRALIGLALSATLLGENHISTSLAGSMVNLSSLHFSREQEYVADITGLRLLQAYYGHAGGATAFFEYLLATQKRLQRWAEFASTHPISHKRINAIHKHIKLLGYPVGTPKDQPFYRTSESYEDR